MLNEANIERVYLACGSTDLRKSIDGLAVLVKEGFELDSFSQEPKDTPVKISYRQLRRLPDGLPLEQKQAHPIVQLIQFYKSDANS